MNRTLSLLAMLILLPVAGATAGPPAPLVVTVVPEGDDVLVSWVPHPSTPEGAAFHVLGWDGAGWTVLGTAAEGETARAAPGGYARYGVATDADGAWSIAGPSCFGITTDEFPPSIFLTPSCLEKVKPRTAAVKTG